MLEREASQQAPAICLLVKYECLMTLLLPGAALFPQLVGARLQLVVVQGGGDGGGNWNGGGRLMGLNEELRR